MMKRHLVLLLVLVAVSGLAAGRDTPGRSAADDFVAPGRAVALPRQAAALASAIRAERLAARIQLLSAPSLEGRGLGGQGLDMALDYAASSLALAGVPPLASTGRALGAYDQPVPVRAFSGAVRRLTIAGGSSEGARPRAFGEPDCAFPNLLPQQITAPVAAAGFGIREPSVGRDDLESLDLHGKIAVILGGLPPGRAWQTPALLAKYGAPSGRARYETKLRDLEAAGVRAVLVVEADEAVRREDAAGPTYYRPVEEDSGGRVPIVCVSPAVAEALLSAAGFAGAPLESIAPRVLPGVVATLSVDAVETRLTSRNVIGVIRGSDAALADTAIVIGAHVDHLGRDGATIFPGADDNASGVAALLEIAHALAASAERPKRSVVFAIWTGEEEGKLGSGYYVRHPAWPLARTAAYLNLDMIGHPWLREEIEKLVEDAGLERGKSFLAAVRPADFVEPGVAAWAPELCPVLARAGRGLGLALHFDRTSGVNGGSDYRDFARARVPFVRFFGNYFPGYHQASDTGESVDPIQVQKVARLAAASAWLLANR